MTSGGIELPTSGEDLRRTDRPQVAYDGTSGSLGRIAVVNALLSILTLGMYRFWGKTRLRRYIWGHFSLNGDRFEYTGLPGELLRGFLVAVGVIGALILGLALVSLATDVETESAGIIQWTADILQGLIFLYLFQFAVYTARRYRLGRTQLRGVRGGQSGSAHAYAWRATCWMLLTMVTLGLAYPVMRTRLQSIKTGNTWFGSRKFDFDGRAGEIFKTWFVAWILLIPSLGISYVWYRAREFKYFARCTRFGELRFDAGLKARRIVVLIVVYYGAVAGALIMLWMVAWPVLSGVLIAAAQVSESEVSALSLGQIGMGFLVVVIFLAVMSVLRVVVLVVPMLQTIAESVHIEGEIDFAAITQSDIPALSRGEGLADALDVGGF